MSDVPHCFRLVDGEWALVPVPVCPWCGGNNHPLRWAGGHCNSSWHRSHREHGLMWYRERKGECD